MISSIFFFIFFFFQPLPLVQLLLLYHIQKRNHWTLAFELNEHQADDGLTGLDWDAMGCCEAGITIHSYSWTERVDRIYYQVYPFIHCLSPTRTQSHRISTAFTSQNRYFVLCIRGRSFIFLRKLFIHDLFSLYSLN